MDDPFSILSLAVWLFAASMWPVGFLFAMCSPCCDCGFFLAYERCLRIEVFGNNHPQSMHISGGYARLQLGHDGPDAGRQAVQALRGGFIVGGPQFTLVNSPTQLSFGVRISLSAAGNSRTPIGATRTLVYQFNRRSYTPQDYTRWDSPLGAPWHLRAILNVTGVRQEQDVIDEFANFGSSVQEIRDRLQDSPAQLAAFEAKMSEVEPAGVEVGYDTDIYDQVVLVFNVKQGRETITHTAGVTTFPVGLQRLPGFFPLTEEAIGSTRVLGGQFSGWSVSKEAGISVGGRSLALVITGQAARPPVPGVLEQYLFNEQAVVNFLSGSQSLTLTAKNQNGFFGVEYSVRPASLICDLSVDSLREGIALGVYPPTIGVEGQGCSPGAAYLQAGGAWRSFGAVTVSGNGDLIYDIQYPSDFWTSTWSLLWASEVPPDRTSTLTKQGPLRSVYLYHGFTASDTIGGSPNYVWKPAYLVLKLKSAPPPGGSGLFITSPDSTPLSSSNPFAPEQWSQQGGLAPGYIIGNPITIRGVSNWWATVLALKQTVGVGVSVQSSAIEGDPEFMFTEAPSTNPAPGTGGLWTVQRFYTVTSSSLPSLLCGPEYSYTTSVSPEGGWRVTRSVQVPCPEVGDDSSQFGGAGGGGTGGEGPLGGGPGDGNPCFETTVHEAADRGDLEVATLEQDECGSGGESQFGGVGPGAAGVCYGPVGSGTATLTRMPTLYLENCGPWRPVTEEKNCNQSSHHGVMVRDCQQPADGSVSQEFANFSRNDTRIPRASQPSARTPYGPPLVQPGKCQMRKLSSTPNPYILTSVNAGQCFVDFPEATGEILRAPGPPSNVTVIRGQCSSAVVSWSPPFFVGNYPVTKYELQYRTGHSTTGGTVLDNLQTTSVTISGLGPEQYSFRVRAWACDPSPWVEVSTSDWVPGPPQSLSITRESCDSATLSWVPPNTSRCSPLGGYVVNYRIFPDGNLTVLPDLDPTEKQVEISGLQANVPYEFRVGSFVPGGRSRTRYSSFLRVGLPPAPLESLTATLAAPAGSVDLLWDFTPEPCYAVEFRVQYRPRTPVAISQFTTLAELGADDRSFLITGLSLGASYEFRVIATNDFGSTSRTTPEFLIPESEG
jgi:hypothetical protein